MQGVSRRYRCLTRQPFTSGAGEFSGVTDLAVSGEAEVLCVAEESGMPWCTGCARRTSTHGKAVMGLKRQTKI